MEISGYKIRVKIARLALSGQFICLTGILVIYFGLALGYRIAGPFNRPVWMNLYLLLALDICSFISVFWLRRSLTQAVWGYAWSNLIYVVLMLGYRLLDFNSPKIDPPYIIFLLHLNIFSLGIIFGFRPAFKYALATVVVFLVVGIFYTERLSIVVGILFALLMTFPPLGIDKLMAELRQSQEKLSIIFRESPDVILVLDPATGRIWEGNAAVKWVLGYVEEELRGEPFSKLYESDSPLGKEKLWYVEAQRRDTHGSQFFLKADGTRCPMDWTAARIPWDEDSAILITLRDVTERYQAEVERARFTAQLGAAAELAARINAYLDADQLLPMVVAQVQSRLDVARAAIYLLNEDLQAALSPAVKESVSLGALMASSSVIARVVQNREMVRIDDLQELSSEDLPFLQAGMQTQLVVPLIVQDCLLGVMDLQDLRPGRFHTIDLDVFFTLGVQIATSLENARLFGELQKTARNLQGLSHRLVAVQEQERRNIACELHDEIGQMLTALKLMLDMSSGAGDSQQEARDMVRDLLERVRNLSLELRPPMLDDLGILPALVWLFNRYTTQTHIKVSFRHSGLERRFTPQIETAAYRVIQESLTNVARHARVQEVEVRLWADEAQLQVQVEDNGQGFDLDEVLSQAGSNGLSGMRERVMLLGGELTIDSRPGAGTSLVAELPLQ